jgi:murein L,D-transpeptidase YcbB/YkuD
MSRPLIAALIFAALAPAGSVRTQAQPPIAAALHRPPAAAARPGLEDALPAVTRFYEKRNHEPVWTGPSQLNPAGESVMRAVARAGEDGLNADDYVPAALAGLASQRTAQATIDLDVLLSLVVVRFARDLGWGITVPSEVDRDNSYDVRPFDAETVLGAVAAAADPGEELRKFAPPSFVYGLVKSALAELRARRDKGGWTRATDGPTLRKGDRSPRVAELRTMLVERGDLPPGPKDDLFDETLVDGLERFQDRHGLEADGIYGKKVLAELGVPLSTRIEQVRLGLERLRWLPRTSTGRRVGVNLADFRTYVFDDDRVTFETRSVVGKLYHETPMFTGRMTYIVINPYWNVPTSIMRNELLPKAKADAEYLAKNHFEYDGTSMRQLPGPWNSLGRFKFMFPNPHNIYLHDTPARGLFNEADRAFSHGCVRLEKPAELAALLLADQGWTPERIRAAVETGAETVVTLQKPIPVYITYITAFLGVDGLMHYRRDVYGRDQKLLAALQQVSQGAWDR